MRDSFIFYRSFFEAGEKLPQKDRQKFYVAIIEYALNDIEPNLKGIADGMFSLAKPQIDANKKRFDNGKKGGRPKSADERIAEARRLNALKQ